MKRPWNNEGGDGATVKTVERTADAADPQVRRFKKGFVRVGRMPRGDVVPLFRRAQVKQENAYRLADDESRRFSFLREVAGDPLVREEYRMADWKEAGPHVLLCFRLIFRGKYSMLRILFR